MSYAPDYTPGRSFADDETNNVAGRSLVKTDSLDAELADISSSINALNTNQKALQRDDNKLKDGLVEPYALSEQTRSLIAIGGCNPRGTWAPNTDYFFKDIVQRSGVAYIGLQNHNSGTSFSQSFWLPISGDGSSFTSAAEAALSASAAATSAASASSSASTASSAAANANTSASSATTSATNASNSASNAAASATNAANSASEAAAIATGLLSDRNRIINGSCQVVNIATFVASNNTSGYGGPEMYLAINNNAGGQFTQSQGSLTYNGSTYQTVRQTVDNAISSISGSNYWSGIIQRIEGFNASDLIGKQLSVSFIFKASVTGAYSVGIKDGADGQSYVSTFNATAGAPVYVNIPISTVPSAASVPNTNGVGLSIAIGAINSGSFQTSSLNSWQSGNLLSASGSVNWATTPGNYIELTNLQLEEGNVSTPFVRRSIGQEVLLTQRYFQTRAFFSTGYGASGGFIDTDIPFAVPMRAAPTFIYGSISYTNSSLITAVAVNSERAISRFTVTSIGQATVNTSWTASARL